MEATVAGGASTSTAGELQADEEEVRIQVDDVDLSPPDGRLDLFSGDANEYLKLGVPLYQAALEGDWETAKAILQTNQHLARASISKSKDTALHIAAAARRTDFVKKLVQFMKPDDLAVKNRKNNTALAFAAASGNVEIARVIVEKNESLPLIRERNGMTPVYMAILLGHREMAWYLMSVTDFDELTPLERFELLITSINSDLYDVALEILMEYPELAECQDANCQTALHFLARKRLKSNLTLVRSWMKWRGYNCLGKQNENLMEEYALELVHQLWGKMLSKGNYQHISLLYGSPAQLLFDAAEIGNIEFITILIKSYPDLIWKVNTDGVSIFHIAVSKRQAEVFNLIYEIGAIKDLLATYTDTEKNNMLHLVAMSPSVGSLDNISGAALKMQRELLWFKEVERVVPPQFRHSKNNTGETPRYLFTKEHKQLRKEGEEWMKTTAGSCSVVAALIATVVFTAAFTVPGGNTQDKGIPIFQRNPIFVVFAISDAISLFSSSASILMFLGILTSRYSEEDFLKSLPRKLMMGLSSLFVSITCMMVAFSTTFFIVFKAGHAWISIPIVVAGLAVVPVILFAFQKYSLLADIYRSTYHARYLFRPKKHRIFMKNKHRPAFLKRLTLKFLGKD